MKEFITEHQSPHLDLNAEVTKVLYKGKSKFQDIIVADSIEYGRMLVLDGVFQTSDRDEFTYHENIVHIPMFLHPIRRTSSSSAAATAAQREKLYVIPK